MTRMIGIEALRGDWGSQDENQVLGLVTKVNKIKGTIDARARGELQSVMLDVSVVGAESVHSISVGDTVAISRFSGQWVCLGKVYSPRREELTHTKLIANNSLTSYGPTYTRGDVIIGTPDGCRLMRVGNDLYWWDGSSSTKLN